jgi:hypothetical protein
MAASLIAPALGLLALAALGALALAAMEPLRPVRLDGFSLAVCAALAAAAAAVGMAGAIGVLFVWLVLDAARAQLRRLRARPATGQSGLAERLTISLAAGLAICLVAASSPHVVMGLPLVLPHPPAVAILALGLAYSLAVVDWAVRILARWRLGEGDLAPAAEAAAFHAVLLAGFALCPDVSAGVAGLMAYRLAQAVPALTADRVRLVRQAGS